MINTFRAQNYGCLKDVTVDLTPLHAFVGPNDSGKSTLLRGIRTVVQFAAGKFGFGTNGDPLPFDPLLTQIRPLRVDSSQTPMLMCGSDAGTYGIRILPDSNTEEFIRDVGNPLVNSNAASRSLTRESIILDGKDLLSRKIKQVFSGARLLRLDPDAMLAPSKLIDEPLDFLNDRGAGLAGVYQAILGRGDDAGLEIRSQIRKFFPGIKRIGVKTSTHQNNQGLVLEGELTDGSKFDAAAMSEGLLYFLAFSLIPYLRPVSLLLIEEPENGLHPARIQEVMHTLRAFVETTGTQVLMATHSPLVINELRPEEVSVVTKPSIEVGSKVTRIKDTPNFAKRSSVYALGELWLAYADGKLETPLFEGGGA
jgi:predicted ATPase